MPDATGPAPATYRPLPPENRDQGDPYALAVPPEAGAEFRYYVYATGEDPAAGMAFPVYGSNDLTTWQPLGKTLRVGQPSTHWAPCVCYLPELRFPYVML